MGQPGDEKRTPNSNNGGLLRGANTCRSIVIIDVTYTSSDILEYIVHSAIIFVSLS